jgi:hypothetical protein
MSIRHTMHKNGLESAPVHIRVSEAKFYLYQN